MALPWLSTTVEITIGYLTVWHGYAEHRSTTVEITIGYLTPSFVQLPALIYNSRNYYRLLNKSLWVCPKKSTTVEITIGYLTSSELLR